MSARGTTFNLVAAARQSAADFFFRLKVLVVLAPIAARAAGVDPQHLERSYWLHASLGLKTEKSYWGTNFPSAIPPTRTEVFNAARWLTGPGAANRLYLIYHSEIPEPEACKAFAWWREACPASVCLVPTLVLSMYDSARTPVFPDAQARRLAAFFRSTINSNTLAVYDVYPRRDQGSALPVLAERFPAGLVRVGLQPGEELASPFVRGVQDTWSGFCHGTRNQDDWLQPGFGAATLRGWVEERNLQAKPIAWDLITVAWDYQGTERGAFPGYDDAKRNMPLPEGRTRLGVNLIRGAARPDVFAGFSSDLFILQANSLSEAHDGPKGCFYQALKNGQTYTGYYAKALKELTEVYQDLRNGRWPASTATTTTDGHR